MTKIPSNAIYFKTTIILLGECLNFALGGIDSLIYALIALAALDYITGIIVAIHCKKLSSEIGFKGICKKAMMFIIIMVGNLIDKYVLETESTLRTLLIMFYISNEGISILENANAMGIPLPQKLKGVLIQLSNDEQKNK